MIDPRRINELDEDHWYFHADENATPRSILEHLRLIRACDLSYPIILDQRGRVMDGMHRICRAILEGVDQIPAVQFIEDPEPDFVNCVPEELPYEGQPTTSLQDQVNVLSPAAFVRSYELALTTQDWSAVEPLVHENASVTFSNGTQHKGKEAVRAAFERNFRTIVGERYRISNVHWLAQSDDAAVYLFDFHWTGTIDGRPASGAGRGTTALVRDGGAWQLLTEHLGPAPR